MTQKKAKVLMLGWEFPPIMSGGLGVACYGLSKELNKLVDLTMIIPKADPHFIMDRMNLIGTNMQETYDEVLDIHTRYTSEYHKKEEVGTTLLAYMSMYSESILQQELQHKNSSSLSKSTTSTGKPEHLNELYSGDIMSNIQRYTESAVQIALRKNFEIIHAHDWMTFLAGAKLKSLTGKPLVVHIHSLETDRAQSGQLNETIYQIERETMEYADKVISVSDFTKRKIIENYYIDYKKIAPVHNGIEKAVNVPEPKKKESPFKTVLFLGRITFQKGPEFFLEVAARVLDAIPNVRFVMAGTGDRLKQIIHGGASKRIGDRFHFTGFLNREKVNNLLAISDVYVMPSVSEPFGLSALEAVQLGVPCIISKQSGVAEVLPNAIAIDFWDRDKMASSIIALLKNQSLREEIIKNAKKDLEKITWDSAALKIESIYNQML